MSFCPTKDIHSIYLDNELPQVHKEEYEKHISQCEKCRSELNKLKAVHDVLKADSDSISVDEKFMEESYQRLMIKMAYNKNKVKANKKSPILRFTYIISAAAAAVVMALFVPLGLRAGKNTVAPAVASLDNGLPIQTFGNNVSFGSGKDVVVSGNIKEGILSSYTRNCDRGNLMEEIKDADLLRPEFTGDNIISIRITVPSVRNISKSANFEMLGGVASGNYEWNHLVK